MNNDVVVGRAGHGPDWDQAGGHPRGEEHDLQVAREAALHQAQDGRGDRTGDDGALAYNQCWEPWHFDADPHRWLMDPDPSPDPTPFFSNFKDAKNYFLSYFFLITYPQAHYLRSWKFNFLQKFCIKILFCKHYLWEKGRIRIRSWFRIHTSN